MDLCIDCNLLFAELKKHGFCLGFSTIEDVALSKEQVDYWHRGNFVCYVKSKGLIATYVCGINIVVLQKIMLQSYCLDRSHFLLY